MHSREPGFTATLTGRWPDEKGALFCFSLSDEPHALMAQYGHVPLPPSSSAAMEAPAKRTLQKTNAATKPCSLGTLVPLQHLRQACTLTMPC